MKKLGTAEGIGLAIALSLVGGISYAILSNTLDNPSSFRSVVGMLSLFYTLYLLARSHEKTGRLVTLVIWFLVTGASSVLISSLPLYVITHLGFIWLVRALFFHSSISMAILDLGLISAGLLVANWALIQTNSLTMSIWSFFLLQVLFISLVKRNTPTYHPDKEQYTEGDRFQRALSNAEKALQKISSAH